MSHMKPFPFALAAVLIAGCGRPEAAAPTAELPAAVVATAVVTSAARPQTRRVAGIVRPRDRAEVSARVMGPVSLARLAVGQRVQAGEVLVQIAAGEITAQLEQARAALVQAERDSARETALAEKGAASAESMRQAADQRRIAQARLTEALAMVGYTQIAAPFDGVITADLINTGDLATPGQHLFTLEADAHLRAEVPVPESLATIALGSPVVVQGDDQTLPGTLVELSPAADPTTRTRLAKIALPDDVGVRSGQFVRALWPVGTATVLSVPRSAVQIFGQIERVFVRADGRAQLRLVRTGAEHGDTVQILAGLEAGETVVLNPPPSLRDGQLLEATP